MLNVTDLRNGVAFEENGELYKVLSYDHIKMGRGSASIRVKVKNLRTGAVIEKSFINGAKVNDTSLLKKKYQYLYKDRENAYFMDEVSYEQIPVALAKLGDDASYLKEGINVSLLFAEDEPLTLELPPKMDFTIAETGPDLRGNSATNIFKEAVLENGLRVRVPLFMKVGERVVIDTRTGQYSERARPSPG